LLGDGKHIREDFSFRAEDKAVMLVLCDIDADANHSKTSDSLFDAALSTVRFAL
jgi:hypothetical protein